MKDHSQNGEQKIILDYFGDFRGTVLDCGANDGVLLSNSRALVELGWSAVLVEPAEIAFGKLKDIYLFQERTHDQILPVVKIINAAITTQDGQIDFYSSGTHLKKGDTDLLSTTRPEEIERWRKSGEVFTKTTVRGITVATLLKETGLTRADFISIDCEGVDLAVLRQLDLTALGTRMVCVEVNNKDQKPFIDYCAGHGLRLHRRCVENLIFARQP